MVQLYKISITADEAIVLLVFLYLLWGIYPLMILRVLWAWRNSEQTTSPEDCKSLPMVSIIIVFRNEARHIPDLLRDLYAQNWPADHVEIIMVDDHSDDGSSALAFRFLNQHPDCRLRVLSLPDHNIGSPKKEGIQMAVQAARGNIILCTDADCRLSPEWICSMTYPLQFGNADFVAGPVMFYGDGFWNNVLQIEFSSLVASAAASIYYNVPLMSNGANMAFSKEAFFAAGAFQGDEGIASGDDVTLMMNIHKENPGGIVFLKDDRARVLTAPPAKLSSFVQQRLRWAGKWNRGKQRTTRWIPFMVFLYHLSLITGISLFFFIKKIGIFLILALLCKGIAEFALLGAVMAFFKRKMRLDAFLLTFSIYPFYAVFFGLAVQIKGFYWKDRPYKKL